MVRQLRVLRPRISSGENRPTRRRWRVAASEEARPSTESGVWCGVQNARTVPRRPSSGAVVAWCLTLLFLAGVVTLFALTLVEITERLVELRGAGARVRAAE